MQVMLEPGHYVAAVSGGVDSMVMLDLLRKRPGIKLTVAHLDHGIRPDSHIDRRLVQDVAHQYGVPFVHKRVDLGPDTSEAAARQARYDFLHTVRQATGAKAIATAHHQDDRLETVIFNMLRGTNRKGFAPLRTTDGIIRPLLTYPKSRIIDYAQNHGVSWREDVTNMDTRYTRNHIRHHILPIFTEAHKAQLNILVDKIDELNWQIDQEISHLLHMQPSVDELNRHMLVQLPHRIATDLMHTWLLRHGAKNITARTVERLVHAVKTARIGSRHKINKNAVMEVADETVTYRQTTG